MFHHVCHLFFASGISIRYRAFIQKTWKEQWESQSRDRPSGPDGVVMGPVSMAKDHRVGWLVVFPTSYRFSWINGICTYNISDWWFSHILYDFPETVGNGMEKSSQLTNSLHDFSEGLVAKNHQPPRIGWDDEHILMAFQRCWR